MDKNYLRIGDTVEDSPVGPGVITDIIRMAREAGFSISDGIVTGGFYDLGRFAALVAAAEREAIAKMIEERNEWRGRGWVSTLCHMTTSAIAAAIRARGTA